MKKILKIPEARDLSHRDMAPFTGNLHKTVRDEGHQWQNEELQMQTEDACTHTSVEGAAKKTTAKELLSFAVEPLTETTS
jgi:hypothetical protein